MRRLVILAASVFMVYACVVAVQAQQAGTQAPPPGTGTQAPPTGAGKMTAKADLVAAMKSSIAECDKAFATLTDAGVVQMVTGGRGGARSRVATLYGMIAHDNEEYGYLAVHLRLKGIVPPSSEGGMMMK